MKIKKYLPTLGLFLLTLTIIGVIFLINYYSKAEETVLSNKDEEIQIETNNSQDSNYPRNLIEGAIVSIKLSPTPEIKMTVNIKKILLDENVSQKEVIVLMNESTKFFLFDLNTGEETKINIQDLKEGNQVLVAIVEDNRSILTQEVFTATAVRKLILPPPESNI